MHIEALKEILCSWIEEGFLEGELSVDPGWYVLWLPVELEELNQGYQLSEFAPGFIAFGGNGGELLALNQVGEVFYLPAIGMEPDDAIKIAGDLLEFKGFMSK
ncbi:hypothetical protein H8K35_14975 [Undibacterium sp. LX40W]|uniref:SMI1/KNR4 family protein SUKH-1 n=1 Tax=Undibacterium nitidum TaxID=2762298 RepID=A0A923KQE7_9BURK|nr:MULTISPECIES: hypothetical protein [Undibacterium]MBC3882843.1 hypothetical protein [Undibacterium nitidum]MBC3892974.1 hypothetical protein [Undibacterium sp. LX40W]